MKHTFNTTSEAKKSILRDILLAIAFLIIAFLMFSALTAVAQTPETLTATRYGKEVVLTKDKSARIVEFIPAAEESSVFIKWETKNTSGQGVYAVMRSENGIHYAYVSFILASKGENHFSIRNDSGNKRSYYRVLYISEQNTFCLSERKNISDL